MDGRRLETSVNEATVRGARRSPAQRNGRAPLASAPAGAASLLERGVVRSLLRAAGHPPVAIVLWTGEEFAPPGGEPLARIMIRDRRTLWRLVSDPLYQFGESYSSGALDVEGDLVRTLEMVERALGPADQRFRRRKWLTWLRRPRRTTPSAARENIHHHYDLGNAFYELWLDQQLVYTCAYFPDPSCTLEDAQIAKMDHVCRKVRLRPGETVIEAGCGWGALALHMARRYGVRVRAYNISREQLAYARDRAAREGLDGRVEFLEADWRDITGTCDAFISVGMLEHVGRENYRQLGDVIHRCLKPQGRGLIHSIGRNQPRPLNPWIERRIFPGARPPALSEMLAIFEPHDFTVLDVENLRLHYALTLRHWLERFERAADAVRTMFDERFVRLWRLYLSGSVAAFEAGGLQLFQIAFNRGANEQTPWTRAHIYCSSDVSG